MSSHANESTDRIITIKAVRAMVPYSAMHLSRLERAGQFPKRVHLGSNRVGWSLQEVQDWVEQKKSER